jgi:glycosidase
MNDINAQVLRQVRGLGITHIWYTGVIRHATATDYTAYAIPRQHPSVVKGRAGSPYAIADYYDIDPDLAEDVARRMEEFRALVRRTHEAGLKVIIDFVPNHVAREYRSICKPQGVRDLGQDDDTSKHFDPQNNFYYCPGASLEPAFDLEDYEERPARCTGNDCFHPYPGVNDWYETVKLNYGVDYTGGGSHHFDPIPSTWTKMVDILLFWAAEGVDGFRCDMAEMVPTAFWSYASQRLKAAHPEAILIGEVYNPALYRAYIASGFDYLYDKVGMYDCLRGVVCQQRAASEITAQWQATDDIRDRMLYFLENHDEQRIASDFFCGDARKALPAMMVSAWLRTNPVMVYAGQEWGERGMDHEGFSGVDGRSTIFDYWTVQAVYQGYFDRSSLGVDQRQLEADYQQILQLANEEKALREGELFDLMYANAPSPCFDPQRQYAFLRKKDDELLIVNVNFSADQRTTQIRIPAHAFDFFHIGEGEYEGLDLLTGQRRTDRWDRDGEITLHTQGYGATIVRYKV